jgi:ATP-binding cassette subfamily E protein 1
MTEPHDADRYVAVIDQEKVTDEVRDIAVKYDPLNRSGREGFHVTDDGELHIDDSLVMEEHKLIERKVPNDAIKILPLPARRGQLVHQYGENGFQLYDLPAPERGDVIGILGPNGIGKTTALCVLAGDLQPNLGRPEGDATREDVVRAFRGSAVQRHLERLREGDLSVAFKPQRIESLPWARGTTVEDALSDVSAGSEAVADALDLAPIADRELRRLSGGERQRVAIAATLLRDADLYLLDEPSSYLDVGRRLDAARAIRGRVADEDAAAVVVEHDLATLDLLSDGIYLLYGEAGGFGVVSQRQSVREGINQFLRGRLREGDVRIRPEPVEFPPSSERTVRRDAPVLEYPALEKRFDGFSLTVDPGRIHEGEVVGVVGRNALGKTTFAKLIAGVLTPDEGTVSNRGTISYKPQYVAPSGQETVRALFARQVNVRSPEFRTGIEEPFDLEALYDSPVSDLSGGELQRASVALCLSRDADLYLLDEPSAYLDAERRTSITEHVRAFAKRTERPVLVIDHDVYVVDRVADRLLVFEGDPGRRGHANPPQSMREGMNAFLSPLDVTFRRDGRTGRPRINKPGSRLDREQKRRGEYYYPE